MRELTLPARPRTSTSVEEPTIQPRLTAAPELGLILQQTARDIAAEAEAQRRQEEARLRAQKREAYQYD